MARPGQVIVAVGQLKNYFIPQLVNPEITLSHSWSTQKLLYPTVGQPRKYFIPQLVNSEITLNHSWSTQKLL